MNVKKSQPTSDVPERILYDGKETCHMLNIGMSHLYNLMAAGRIKSIKINNRRLFHKSEIERVAVEGA